MDCLNFAGWWGNIFLFYFIPTQGNMTSWSNLLIHGGC